MNTNILNWYPFKEKATILYLTVDEEKNIEEYLSNVSAELKTIKFYNSEYKDNIEKLEIESDKYDYVILLGILEYASEIIKEKNSYEKLLCYAKQSLKEDGIALLAIDNRMGVKYLVGNKSEHCEKIYDSVKNVYKTGKMFSLNEINKIIEKVGFDYRKNYYPLPNYKYPNVIYSDELIPEINDSKINYNFIYDEGSLVLQSETILLKQFIRIGNFKEYTNSYLIELSNKKINNDIKYVSYNNMRKDEYSLILKMKNEIVEKTARYPIANKHISAIKENNKKLKELGFQIAEEDIEEEIIKSKFVEKPILDSYIVKLIKQGNILEVYNIIETWYSYITEKLKIDENGNIKDGYIDLVFENTFYDENQNSFIFFDQEWYMENIPLDFILYRAIQNLYAHNKSINNYLQKEEIMNKYNLNNRPEFEELERVLQEKVVDEEKRKFYSEQYKYLISSEEIIKIISDLKKVNKDNEFLVGELNRIKQMSVFDFIKNKLKR